MNELEITVAAPFRHGRKDQLSKMELVFYYVQDKRWMNPDQAKKLIDLSIKRGFLIKEEGKDTYRCAIPVTNIIIPLGFRPGDEIFSEEQDAMGSLINDIAAATEKSKKDLVAEMQEISKHFDNLLAPEVSVILLAKKYGVSAVAYLPALRVSMHKGE